MEVKALEAECLSCFQNIDLNTSDCQKLLKYKGREEANQSLSCLPLSIKVYFYERVN